MDYRKLGTTELEVSSVGMGCVTFGREIDKADSFQVLDQAWERGITLFDTAAAYAEGASETVLGDWIAERRLRDKLVLATKVHGPLTREHILRSADESLQRLRTDRVDLFQCHVWDDETPLAETLGALDELVAAGKARAVGCSNWQAWHLAKGLLLSAREDHCRLQSVQPPYNLVQREIEADLLPLCQDQRVAVISYSPLAAGFLAGKYRRGKQVPKGTRFDVIPGHQPIYFTDHGYAVLEQLDQAAETTGRTLVELSLAWALNQPLITSVLIGARNVGHINQAFTAMALPWNDLEQALELA